MSAARNPVWARRPRSAADTHRVARVTDSVCRRSRSPASSPGARLGSLAVKLGEGRLRPAFQAAPTGLALQQGPLEDSAGRAARKPAPSTGRSVSVSRRRGRSRDHPDGPAGGAALGRRASRGRRARSLWAEPGRRRQGLPAGGQSSGGFPPGEDGHSRLAGAKAGAQGFTDARGPAPRPGLGWFCPSAPPPSGPGRAAGLPRRAGVVAPLGPAAVVAGHPARVVPEAGPSLRPRGARRVGGALRRTCGLSDRWKARLSPRTGPPGPVGAGARTHTPGPSGTESARVPSSVSGQVAGPSQPSARPPPTAEAPEVSAAVAGADGAAACGQGDLRDSRLRGSWETHSVPDERGEPEKLTCASCLRVWREIAMPGAGAAMLYP